MHPLVFKQLLSSFEPQFTVITLKRFCPCVSELVPFTDPTALERPSAETASSSTYSFPSNGGPRDLPNLKHTGIYDMERGRTGGIIKGVKLLVSSLDSAPFCSFTSIYCGRAAVHKNSTILKDAGSNSTCSGNVPFSCHLDTGGIHLRLRLTIGG